MSRVLCGDALEMLRTLPDGTVQCCVTSPPYFGLRDYGVPGQMGMEGSPEEYVDRMVGVFREVRRVLRDDGILWLNIGDSYAGSGGAGGDYNEGGLKAGQPKFEGTAKLTRKSFRRDRAEVPRSIGAVVNLKPKDLVGIPWMMAFALRADGWYLRSEVIWAKRNCMPESVQDRPSKSHEQIFLLSKSPRYFYDAEAIRVPASESYRNDGRWKSGPTDENEKSGYEEAGARNPKRVHNVFTGEHKQTSGRRDVWHISTQPRKEAHFATFPDEIPEICIKAGTSQKGQCRECGSPWKRATEPSERYREILGSSYHDHRSDSKKGMRQMRGSNLQNKMRDAGIKGKEMLTTGWQATCDCGAEVAPQIVLDPFAGSGTTLQVAKRLGRDYIGIELNGEYVKALVEPSLEKINPLMAEVNP